ncbi:MAG TPA: hypothetical protein DDW33_05925, partial [Ktedonobacter sp.]|nr:hypothetical protein [Ktedonobacter sp.]
MISSSQYLKIRGYQWAKFRRRNVSHIAWETEVWIAETPEHMIHFNGE